MTTMRFLFLISHHYRSTGAWHSGGVNVDQPAVFLPPGHRDLLEVYTGAPVVPRIDGAATVLQQW